LIVILTKDKKAVSNSQTQKISGTLDSMQKKNLRITNNEWTTIFLFPIQTIFEKENS
jgi:hypothetical protein